MITQSLPEHLPMASFLNILAIDLSLSVQHSDRIEVNCNMRGRLVGVSVMPSTPQPANPKENHTRDSTRL